MKKYFFIMLFAFATLTILTISITGCSYEDFENTQNNTEDKAFENLLVSLDSMTTEFVSENPSSDSRFLGLRRFFRSVAADFKAGGYVSKDMMNLTKIAGPSIINIGASRLDWEKSNPNRTKTERTFSNPNHPITLRLSKMRDSLFQSLKGINVRNANVGDLHNAIMIELLLNPNCNYSNTKDLVNICLTVSRQELGYTIYSNSIDYFTQTIDEFMNDIYVESSCFQTTSRIIAKIPENKYENNVLDSYFETFASYPDKKIRRKYTSEAQEIVTNSEISSIQKIKIKDAMEIANSSAELWEIIYSMFPETILPEQRAQ